MREHARIARFFAPLALDEPGSFSLEDDAAAIKPPAGQSLILTTDSVIAGIHVMPNASAEQVARKLVRRNLSDLAAMGAVPWRYLLNLHTPPGTTDAWFAEFAQTLAEEQENFGMVLIGGDSTSGPGPLHATLTCLGLIDGKPSRRSGAKAGDALYVSGTIGDSALGLQLLKRKLKAPPQVRKFLTARYHQPLPRLALGAVLGGIASAVIDISDGLVADASRMAQASGLGVMIEREAVPLSGAAMTLVQKNPSLWETVLTGGDDYELCFTAPWSMTERVGKLAAKLKLPLTRIGSVTKERGVKLLDIGGKEIHVAQGGYEH